MRQKTTILKSLLAMALLCVGGNVWADVAESKIVNCDFENGETLFSGVERCTVTNAEDATLNSNVVTFTTGDRAANNYAMAKLDLSLDGATSVAVEFDVFISSNNPNYHKMFAIGDGAKRTYEKGGYNGNGCAFYIGLLRASGLNYFSINGSRINNSSMFDNWLHVEATIDLVTRQVTYAVKDITKTTTHYSGTVSFADPSVEVITRMDYYACINSITDKLDNLVVTKYVDDAVFDYSVKAVDGDNNELAILNQGKARNDGNTNVFWNKFKEFDGMWYETTATGMTITEAGNTNVVYIPSDIYYFIECENMTKSRAAAAEVSGTSYSGGKSPRLYGNGSSSYWYTDALEGGTYNLFIPYTKSATSGTTIDIYTRDSDGNLTDTGKDIVVGASAGSYSGTVTIPDGSSLVLYKDNTGNSNAYMDYLTLTPVPLTGTIASSGYSSLASKYTLDFANATVSTGTLTAFVVSNITSNAIMLSSVTEIPKNSGVILKGTADATYSIPVKATAATPATNKLKAAVSATPVAANEVYILKDGKFTLVTASSTVPAGKAYLQASDVPASARELVLDFDDTTGITSVNAESLLYGDFYDLQGRRVAVPAKGLYIVNGKKVIIK